MDEEGEGRKHMTILKSISIKVGENVRSFLTKEVKTSWTEAREPFAIINDEVPFIEQLSCAGRMLGTVHTQVHLHESLARKMFRKKLKFHTPKPCGFGRVREWRALNRITRNLNLIS